MSTYGRFFQWASNILLHWKLQSMQNKYPTAAKYFARDAKQQYNSTIILCFTLCSKVTPIIHSIPLFFYNTLVRVMTITRSL
jgi:hypothetical protein